MDELLYKVAITLIPNVGPVTTRNLVSYCGGVKAIFEARKRELLKVPGIGPHIADNIVNQDVLGRAEEELRFIDKHGIRALFYLDDDYPRRLRHYPTARLFSIIKAAPTSTPGALWPSWAPAALPCTASIPAKN